MSAVSERSVAVAAAGSAPEPNARPAAGDPITWREVALVVLAGIALSVLMNWPLPARLGSHIGEDLGDPVRTAWQIAWEGHALLHQPNHFFQGNAFWPLPNSFAFSDSLLGYLPAAVLGSGVHAALVRYNLLFLFAYALCFVGAYLLARELGVRRLGAAVAGAAFAYAPFRLTMNGHLHVISSGGIPLSLFLLVRGYRRAHSPTILAGWLVVAWQLSLGFTLGLQLVYLLAVLAAIAAAAWLLRARRLASPNGPPGAGWLLRMRRMPAASRPRGAAGSPLRTRRLPLPSRRLAAATVVGVLAVAAVGAVQGTPLLRVSHEFQTAKRTDYEVRKYSANFSAFLSAPPEDRAWGGPTKSIRSRLSTPNEQNQFPGVTIFVLALLGVAVGRAFSRRLRVGLAIGVAVLAVCSLGYDVANGDIGFRILHDLAPGWNGVRTPGRLVTLTSLGLALLAAAGADCVSGWLARVRRPARPRLALAVPAACTLVLVGGVLVEGRGTMPNPRVPMAPAAERGVTGPQMDLPTNPAYDRLYQFWTSDRFQPLTNGVSTFSIPALDALRDWMNEFPNAHSIHLLRHLGVRAVFIHLDVERLPIPHKESYPYPADVLASARRSVRGLPVLRVTRVGGTIRYDLAPLPRRVTKRDAQAFYKTIHV